VFSVVENEQEGEVGDIVGYEQEGLADAVCDRRPF